MQSPRIAIRNITRQKKRTALLGGAIGFGVLVIILLGSFTAGVLANARLNFTGIFGGHIYVRGEELSSSGRVLARIGDRAILQEVLASLQKDIAGFQVRSQGRGELIFGSKQEGVTMEGVDWGAEPGLWEELGVTQGQREGLARGNAVILPASAAANLGVQIGETVLFKVSTITGQANVGELTVVGVYPQQEGFGVVSAYAGLPYLNGLLGLRAGEFQSMNISVLRMQEIDAVAARLYAQLELLGNAVAPRLETIGGMGQIRAMLGGLRTSLGQDEQSWEGTRFTVTTLNEVMAPLLSIVQGLNLLNSALFIVLLVIIMVGLLNSFRMILIERTQEIGTMRAIGMQRSGVRNIFLLEALFLALAGALAGLALAVLLMGALGGLRFAQDNEALRLFTHNGSFSFPLVARQVVLTLVLIAGGTLLSAWLPARKASRLNPADALRATY